MAGNQTEIELGEFQPLDKGLVEVRSFDCGKESLTTYLRRYAAKNAALNISRTYVASYATGASSKAAVAAYYTLAPHTLYREQLPTSKSLPRYPLPVVLLAQLAVDRRFQGQGLGKKTLVHALRHAYRITQDPNALAALGVVIDVLDQEAMSFYRSFNLFAQLPDDPARLFVPMASLKGL